MLYAEVGLEPELMLWETNAQDKTGARRQARVAWLGPSTPQVTFLKEASG